MALGRKPIEIVEEGKHQLLVKAKHWKRINLNQVAKVQNGYAFSSDYFTKGEGMPLIRIRDIDNCTTVDKYSGKYNDDFIVTKGDILIGMDGDFNAARWKGEKALLNQRVCRIIPFSKEYSDKFLFLCLQPFLSAIHEETSAVTVKHISSKTIEELPLPFPPIKEQQAIVSKIEELFSELDKGIESLKTAQQQLKIYRLSVLNWSFETIKEETSIEEITQNSLIGLVRSNAYQNSKQIGVPYLKMNNIDTNGNIDLSDLVYIEASKEEIEKYSLKKGDILINTRNSFELVGKTGIVREDKQNVLFNNNVLRLRTKQEFSPLFIAYQLINPAVKKQMLKEKKATTNVCALYQRDIFPLKVKKTNLIEQLRIIREIEGRLSIADKMEESINQSLQQAEALRQSILKKAFSGELLNEVISETTEKVIPLYKPKNEYFYQLQLLGLIAKASKSNNVNHGEMTLAKYAYLADKIFEIPTYYEYQRWHLGPFPPLIKKAFNNRQYFQKIKGEIEIVNESKLLKYANPYQTHVEKAIGELASIFSKYDEKKRAQKTELLATVCKVVEDIKSTDLKEVRKSMKEWEIKLKNTSFKNKGEKFTEAETKKCLEFIVQKGWYKKLIK